jgi:hypothetical protein
MLTLGLFILAGALAQPDASLTTDYAHLKGQIVEIVLPDGAPLLPGWPESRRRSGRLDDVAPRPRNPGENTLTVTWDEPWAPSGAEKLNDTLRDPSGGIYKLTVLPESPEDRAEHIKSGWTARNFTLIGSDPLDPRAWVPEGELKLAQQAQRMVREAAPASAPAETPSTPTAQTATTPTSPTQHGFLYMRGWEIAIGLIALLLAGAVIRTLVL